MNKYNQEWWTREVKSKCIDEQRKTNKFIKSNVRFRSLFVLSFVVMAVGISIGFLFKSTDTSILTGKMADNNAVIILKDTYYGLSANVIRSVETLIMFIVGIIVGFSIDEHRNRSTIIEEACLLRPHKLEEIVKELDNKGEINHSQALSCIYHIQNGAAQMSKSGDEALTALKDVVSNILKEIK